MKPTRRTQLYRKGGMRPPGGALTAMMRGRPATSPHPSAAMREAQRKRKKRLGKRNRGTSLRRDIAR